MKALSIKQPWAWLTIHGGKDIENRPWKTRLRGRILVHASKAIDVDALADFSNVLPDSLKLGGIIGSVEIVDCVKESDSKWFHGPYGFVLRNPEPLIFTPLKGKVNFFEVDLGSFSQSTTPAKPLVVSRE